jgi:hypothetical protein
MPNGTAKSFEDVVAAIQDLTRVTIAVSGQFESRSEAVRKLHELSIPASRIAAILAMEVKDVTSAISKHKKRNAKQSEKSPERVEQNDSANA